MAATLPSRRPPVHHKSVSPQRVAQYDPYAHQLGNLSENVHRLLTERECSIYDRGRCTLSMFNNIWEQKSPVMHYFISVLYYSWSIECHKLYGPINAFASEGVHEAKFISPLLNSCSTGPLIHACVLEDCFLIH